jgi:phosphoglycolate phosphatase
VRAVALDLDGTMVDTAPDLALAADAMLSGLGLGPVSLEDVRGFIGRGITSLVERCLAHAANGRGAPPPIARAVLAFEEAYAAGGHRLSLVYPGVVEGMDVLALAGIRLCCITNKAGRFTLPLLAHLNLLPRLEFVVSGDTLPRRKPDPLPLLHACERLGLEPAELLMVGDSEHDTGAARAAGCPVVVVTYGYSTRQQLDGLECDGWITSLADLPGSVSVSARGRSREE